MTFFRSSIIFGAALLALADPATPQSTARGYRFKTSLHLAVLDAGQWRIVRRGVESRKIILERSEPYHGIDVTLLRFDARWITPRIVRSQQYNLKGATVRSLAELSQAIATVNASYFDEKGRALGFLKTSLLEINPTISKSSLFNGIFAVKDLLPLIVHRDGFSPASADEALQAGPLLLTKGAALAVTRGAGRQSRRSVIAVDKQRRLLVAVADSLLGGLNWSEIQELFTAEELQLEAAELLNLDGGGSAQLYLRGGDISEHVPGASEVPVAIGFFPRPGVKD
jgi:uncharacterized protein YigE (DUF2233 family)